jgi:hypothetical protein
MTTIEEVFSIRCKPLLKNKPVDFKSIPICLESENPTDFRLLDKVAKVISDKAFAINSEQRALHVVFVNNFTNHLYTIGNKICEENQVRYSETSNSGRPIR